MSDTLFVERITTARKDNQNPADAATINITVTSGKNTFVKWTSTQNTTINVSSGTPAFGDELTLIITNDATLPRVITLGTLLTSTGIITGVLSKVSIIKFVGNGTGYFEIARTIGI